jgi:hypothetical protein
MVLSIEATKEARETSSIMKKSPRTYAPDVATDLTPIARAGRTRRHQTLHQKVAPALLILLFLIAGTTCGWLLTQAQHPDPSVYDSIPGADAGVFFNL